MMILWHDLLQSRPCYPIPSIHHQTLLSKAIFEHCLDYAQVASIALASKSIQNSSLSPNFAFNVVIDEQSVKLFETVFHPSTSLPVQFVPGLHLTDFNETTFFIESLKGTNYFDKSLRFLTLNECDSLPKFFYFPPVSSISSETEKNKQQQLLLEELDDVLLVREHSPLPIQLPPGMTMDSLFNRQNQQEQQRPRQTVLCSLRQSMKNFNLMKTMSSNNNNNLDTSGNNQEDVNEELQKCFINLQTLELVDCHLTNEGTTFINNTLPSLQSVAFSSIHSFVSEFTQLAVANINKLTTLSINEEKTSLLSDHGVASIFGNSMIKSSLTTLEFLVSASYQHFTVIRSNLPLSLPHVSSLTNLTTLALHDFSGVLNDGFVANHLVKLQNLTSLDLSGNKTLKDPGVAVIATSFLELRTLRLRNCIGITEFSIQSIASSPDSLPDLSELDISGCDNIAADGLKYLGQCTTLTALNISGCFRMTSKLGDSSSTHQNLLASLTRLKKLNIGSAMIDDHGLHNLAALPDLDELDLRKCSALRFKKEIAAFQKVTKLNLSGNGQLGDCSFAGMADAFHNLKSLDLSGCMMLAGQALHYVGSLHFLEDLTLVDCLKVKDEGLCDLVARLHQLKKLNISGCMNVTENFYTKSWTHISRLSLLNVSGCDYDTINSIEAIKWLKSHCPRYLEVIYGARGENRSYNYYQHLLARQNAKNSSRSEPWKNVKFVVSIVAICVAVGWMIFSGKKGEEVKGGIVTKHNAVKHGKHRKQ